MPSIKHRLLVIAGFALLVSGCKTPFGQTQPDGWTTGNAAITEKMKAQNPYAQTSSKKNFFQAAWDKASVPFKSRQKTGDATSLSSTPEQVNVEVHLSAARMLENAGRLDEAIVHYRNALKVEANHFLTLISLARLHDRRGKFDEAVKLYNQAMEAHPRKPLVHNDLGLCFARQGKINESVNYLTSAIQLEPNNKKYRNNVATVLVEAGRMEDAYQHLRAVHAEHIARYNLAVLLDGRQQKDGAVQQLQLALRSKSDFGQAQALLTALVGDDPASFRNRGGVDRSNGERSADQRNIDRVRTVPTRPASHSATPARKSIAADLGNHRELANADSAAPGPIVTDPIVTDPIVTDPIAAKKQEAAMDLRYRDKEDKTSLLLPPVVVKQ